MFEQGLPPNSRESGYSPNSRESGYWPARSSAPNLGLAAMLLAALVLALVPAPRVALLKGAAARLLAPGQRQVAQARDWTLRHVKLLADARATAEQQALVADELRRLRSRNLELEAALALSRANDVAPPPDGTPLLLAGLVPARVLGRQARAFLERADIIDRGGGDGLMAGDLAVAGEAAADDVALTEAKPWIDQGAYGALAVDDLALAGRRVWGRLSEVGPQTARVRRVTDGGYREVVQLAHWGDARWRATARGVLEGTGGPMARVRMVATTEPVSVGDYVLATGARGAVSAPLIYGRVARVERGAGNTNWDIWMAPAVGPDEPGVVAVLRLSLNPQRSSLFLVPTLRGGTRHQPLRGHHEAPRR